MTETVHWKAAVSGAYFDGNNWSTGVAPSQLDIVDLDAAGAKYYVTLNTNGSDTIAYELNISNNAALNIVDSKGIQSRLLSTISTENNGTIKLGVAHGGSGAYLGTEANSPIVNWGLIIVRADGNLVAVMQNYGTIQVVGGYADIHSSGFPGGKFRVNGGFLKWTSSYYLGTVNFNGPNGGSFELIDGFNYKKRIADISGFSSIGATSVQIDSWTRGAALKITSSTKSTTVTLGNGDWIRFGGDYTNATFSAVMQGNNLVITADTKTTSAAPLFSQTIAAFGAATAAPITPAASLHPTVPALLVANASAY